MGETSEVIDLGIIIYGMLGMFILALGVVFFFLTYQKRLFKQQQAHQQKEAEHQQQLLRANFLSQEKERSRIGKDLHDEVGAMLTTSKLYFQHLNQQVNEEKFEEIKAKTMGLLDETMTSVRRVSHDLRPVVLERLGLVEAITNMVDQLNASEQIQVSFHANSNVAIHKEFALNWFRIIQELLNNTLKHAKHIDVHLRTVSNAIVLNYADDGIGLPKNGKVMTGLGMQNIESRLNLMNGQLEIKSKAGEGLEMQLSSELQPKHTHTHD